MILRIDGQDHSARMLEGTLTLERKANRHDVLTVDTYWPSVYTPGVEAGFLSAASGFMSGGGGFFSTGQAAAGSLGYLPGLLAPVELAHVATPSTLMFAGRIIRAERKFVIGDQGDYRVRMVCASNATDLENSILFADSTTGGGDLLPTTWTQALDGFALAEQVNAVPNLTTLGWTLASFPSTARANYSWKTGTSQAAALTNLTQAYGGVWWGQPDKRVRLDFVNPPAQTHTHEFNGTNTAEVNDKIGSRDYANQIVNPGGEVGNRWVRHAADFQANGLWSRPLAPDPDASPLFNALDQALASARQFTRKVDLKLVKNSGHADVRPIQWAMLDLPQYGLMERAMIDAATLRRASDGTYQWDVSVIRALHQPDWIGWWGGGRFGQDR